jgi:hypothetical protein
MCKVYFMRYATLVEYRLGMLLSIVSHSRRHTGQNMHGYDMPDYSAGSLF